MNKIDYTLKEIEEYIMKEYPLSCFACNERDESDLLEDIIEFFMFEKLGICGCGNPEDTIEVIYKYLNIRYEQHEVIHCASYNAYEELNSITGQKLEGTLWNGILQFLMYILDDAAITNHGSSIFGAWLTAEGYMLRSVLHLWEEEKDDEL